MKSYIYTSTFEGKMAQYYDTFFGIEALFHI